MDDQEVFVLFTLICYCYRMCCETMTTKFKCTLTLLELLCTSKIWEPQQTPETPRSYLIETEWRSEAKPFS